MDQWNDSQILHVSKYTWAMTMQISAPTLPRNVQPLLDPSLFNLHEIWLVDF